MTPQERPAPRCTRPIFAFSATPRSFLAAILSFACVLSLSVEFPAGAAIPAAKDKKPKLDPSLKGLPITELSPDEAILHALNRLAYGPRPGDVERVRQMGLAKWIERQLNPNSIDDKGVEARLEDYPTLRMSTAKLIVEYPQPKPAVRQAERQARERAQDEQRRADAAPASEQQTQARETQDAQSSSPSGESVTQSAAENAPAPMKEPAMELDQAARGARRREALGGGDPNSV